MQSRQAQSYGQQITAWRVAYCVVVVLLCAACNLAPRDVSTGRMSWVEYSALQASDRHPEWPYIVQIDTQGGALFYFGAVHTSDPTDPQLDQIERAWKAFAPDIAFTEGGLPPIASSRGEAVRNAGEPGLVRFLAARDNVPTTTVDPSLAQEVAALSREFSRERIKLFFLLRTASQYVRRAGNQGLPAEIERVLSLGSWAASGLSGSPYTVGELEAAYARYFPGAGHYADVPASWFDPVVTDTFLNDISRTSSDYRDEYMVQLLVQQVLEGQRVFAVVGGSHVVMQEAVLRSRLSTSE